MHTFIYSTVNFTFVYSTANFIKFSLGLAASLGLGALAEVAKRQLGVDKRGILWSELLSLHTAAECVSSVVVILFNKPVSSNKPVSIQLIDIIHILLVFVAYYGLSELQDKIVFVTESPSLSKPFN